MGKHNKKGKKRYIPILVMLMIIGMLVIPATNVQAWDNGEPYFEVAIIYPEEWDEFTVGDAIDFTYIVTNKGDWGIQEIEYGVFDYAMDKDRWSESESIMLDLFDYHEDTITLEAAEVGEFMLWVESEDEFKWVNIKVSEEESQTDPETSQWSASASLSPRNVYAGKTYDFEAVVKNTGSEPMKVSQVFITFEWAPEGKGYRFSEEDVVISPGQSSTFTRRITIPTGIRTNSAHTRELTISAYTPLPGGGWESTPSSITSEGTINVHEPESNDTPGMSFIGLVAVSLALAIPISRRKKEEERQSGDKTLTSHEAFRRI